ncbi:TonB-dependent siderophore receptor [Flavobacterium agricola]|uniref:TonB-dependent siderophore receptor n=1 Tax=Flavobacterium agricola TaxID=2870839 RepID=A0ABY6M422_9FLAO|nr:TonB-dependent siderophore receptor [Flavobacterium agricola]UYW02604.1 TonB-dependent siderophore receptor [Flavobacterium agricola]
MTQRYFTRYFFAGGYINAQRNGVDLRPIIKGPLGDDTAIIESIEFVKGPAGFMNAMSDPAGSYNIVTKKPMGINKNTAQFSYGSFGTFRAEADLQGVVTEDRKLAVRFNVMGMKTDGFLKHDNSQRILMAPSFKYSFNEKSNLTLELIYQTLTYNLLSEAQISPYGFGTLPRDFSISDPSMRPYKGNDYNAFLTWEQEVAQDWKLTTRVSNINNDYAGSIFWVYGKNQQDPDILNRYLVYDSVKYNTFSAQSYIQGKFTTGDVKNTFLGGIDFNHKKNSSVDTWGTAETIYPLSISNPQYGQVILNNGIGGGFDSENNIYTDANKTNATLYYVSAHAINESSFLDDKFKVNYGVRLTQLHGNFNQYGDKVKQDEFEVTPRLGLSYLPIESMNIYALYDQSFLPQIGIAHDGSDLKPLKGKSYEVGVKKDWNDGAWNTTASVYLIDRNRMNVNDPASSKIYQTGANRSKGFEFDLKGRIAEGLSVIINYAYTDSKITKDEFNPSMVGAATPNRIRHIQNTWLDYQLPFKNLPGFSVSAGYQYLAGRTERFTTDDPQPLKDIFKVDMGVGYASKKYRVQVMASNLFNEKIYSTAWKRNDMYYWVQQAPRSIRCVVSMNF